MVSWVPWRLCPWHLLKLCSALYVWWDISHWIQLLGFFNICDYPVFTVLFPKNEKKNTRLIAGGCFILEIIGLFWFPGLNWFVCLCVVCRKRNYIRNLKGLVLQMGDYYMDRALHCCWLLHSDHYLILGWWQEDTFSFLSMVMMFFFSFLQVLLSCIGAFCFLNQSEQERMDLQVSKQLLRTCFERFLDNKADLARSPVTRLKDASLSWRSLCFLMTTHTQAKQSWLSLCISVTKNVFYRESEIERTTVTS